MKGKGIGSMLKIRQKHFVAPTSFVGARAGEFKSDVELLSV